MKTFEEVLAFSCGVDGQGIIDHSNCTCNSGELRVFIPPVMALAPGSRVVEIGVFTGRSASVYLQLQPELDLDVHLIDNWSWHAAMATEYFHKLVLEHFNEVPFTYHHCWSQHLGKRWTLPVDFLYVDGWHDLAGVEPDCQLWLPHVRPGGVAAFHDSDWKDVGDCIERYVSGAGWQQIAAAERMTMWRKPGA
jgi:predicted O-methyltransferase YrrM